MTITITEPNQDLPARAHPTAAPERYTVTSIPTNANINGVYAVLQGIRQGNALMGGYGYLEWSTAGNCWHEALDLNSMGGGDADLGARVVAPLGGIVTDVLRWDGQSMGFGNHIAMWIDDPRASQQCYMHVAHLDTMRVVPGQRVEAGEQLGTNGKSGRQPFAHAHTALWHEVPPGGWNFWQTGYSFDWVAAKTLNPETWFWASVTKAGGWVPPEEALAMLDDWQILNWIMPDLWQWASVAYNPEALTSKAWLAELREGRYRGRPRTSDRSYGEGDGAGDWAEFDLGVVVTNAKSGEWSWQG